MIDTSKGFSPENVSREQAKDTGIAMVSSCVDCPAGRVFLENQIYFVLAIPLLLINMTWCAFYRLFAKLWLGLFNLAGTVVSGILLTILFL